MKIPKVKAFRQGDVFVRQVDAGAISKAHKAEPRDNGRVVLAYGEVTGHSHAIAAPGVCSLQATGSEYERLLIGSKVTAFLQHEEHATMPVGGGTYEIIQQQEYSYLEEVAHVVAD